MCISQYGQYPVNMTVVACFLCKKAEEEEVRVHGGEG